jgi:hypothetical protein
MKKKHLKYLILIFLISLAFNIVLSLTSTNFNGDGSYYNLRVFDHIKETGKPLLYDDLSYSGRFVIGSPVFYYLFTIFSFLPILLKIIPALFLSSIIIISYFISKELTGDDKVSLIVSLLSSFIPIYSLMLINQISVYSLIFPLLALMILCFMKIGDKRFFNLFVILSFLLPIIHSSSFIFILVLLFYFLLMISENISISHKRAELIVFSFFLILLINLLFFKKAFFQYGFNFIYGSVPVALLKDYLQTFNILEIFYYIGVLPLVFGIWGLYVGFKQKKESVLIVSSLILGILFMFLFGMIEINIGLLFLSFGLILLSSLGLKSLFDYLTKTKLSKFSRFFTFAFVILIILLSFFPTYYSYDSNIGLSDFEWMKENIPYGSVVLAPVEYGHFISYYNKKNVADTNYLLAPNANDRFNDINEIYTTWSYNKATDLLKNYDVDYIYINEKIKNKYKINDIKYIEDGECIRRLKETVYSFNC